MYNKPNLTSYSAGEMLEEVGPIQTQYGVQAEIWRTGQLNQPRIKQYEIVKISEYPDAGIQSKIISKTV